uniref:uncharacterized protein LOC120331431 isoform X1 n=1 Tax=Styela clava TaxID=7725 RepID=UPI00193A0BAA|nr:uncharacterized protein LOC120331431 isoform X1 [Styela clava]
MKISFIIIGILSTLSITYGAPVEGVLCQINPFQKSTFESSLLLENHLMCPTEGDFLHPAEYCEHLYKCPLDFDDKIRHCEAFCKSDGTWDYKYPTCDDMVPFAELLDSEVTKQEAAVRKRRRRRRRMAIHNNADAILEALKERETLIGKEVIIEVNIRKRRSFGWGDAAALEKPAAKSAENPAVEPGDLVDKTENLDIKELEESIDNKTKKMKKKVTVEDIKALCHKKMCTVVNSDKSCRGLEDHKQADFSLQVRVCDICVKLGVCAKSIKLFTSG